jgi:hypothetical protein
MTTLAAPAPVRPAHLRPVRIGARTHAGILSCDTDPTGGPLYVAACPAGRRADGGKNAREAVPGRVDCGNCTRHHADTVARIHAEQDAAAGRAAVRPVEQAANGRTLTAPAPEILDRAREVGPFGVWLAIRGAADAQLTAPVARRLRAAWVVGALREVYGMGFGATATEILDRAEADTRHPQTRAGEYLAAYAGQIDDRAEPVDLRAAAFQVHDVDQAAAGVRPPVGAWVFVDGFAHRWEVIDRSPVEERRFPFSVRVRQDGHTLNGSVHLSAVTPVPAAPAVVDPAGWVPGVSAGARVAGGVREESMCDAATGYWAAEVWGSIRTGQAWARRAASGVTSPASPDRAAALAAVQILDTVTAGELAGMPGERFETGADGRGLILPDGTRVRVVSASPVDVVGVQRATPGGWRYVPGEALAGRVVRLLVRVEGEPVSMRAPSAVSLPRLADRPGWVLTLPRHARVALAPTV